MSCDFCHKVTKFPAIIRREEVGITNQLCLDCFDKTPPSSLVPENEKNTKEPDFEEHEDNRNNTTCESCGKSYSKLSGLKKHIKIVHEGQRNHKCEHCGKSFSQLSHLRRHRRNIHSAFYEKSFTESEPTKKPILSTYEEESRNENNECDFCGKFFTRPDHLKKHRVIHTGEHKCNSCGKSFTQAGALERHMKNIHAYRPKM